MRHLPRHVLALLNPPHLLQADRVRLRVAVLPEVERGDGLLGERAVRALAEQRHARAEREARLEARLRRARAAQPRVVRAHASHPASFAA